MKTMARRSLNYGSHISFLNNELLCSVKKRKFKKYNQPLRRTFRLKAFCEKCVLQRNENENFVE